MSAQEPLKPAYVIWGEDRATVERALSRLVARVAREGGLPPERMRAEETPAEDVVAAAASEFRDGHRYRVITRLGVSRHTTRSASRRCR